jgi:hypothetical protein
MSNSREDKVVWGIANNDGKPLIVIGIPAAAWEFMKDGKTHHVDLTSAGLPVQFMMFGARDHEHAIELMKEGATAAGGETIDRRNEDFGIKPNQK